MQCSIALSCLGNRKNRNDFGCTKLGSFYKEWPRYCRKVYWTKTKKPLTNVSKRVPGVHGWRGLEKGWQKRLAKGWRKVGERLAKGWHRVGEGLAGFLAPSNFAILEAPV